MATIPEPVLDTRNADQITAQNIASFPPELSDRSDSNPAVVQAEAMGYFFDQLLAAINQWPRGALQKLAALVGLQILDATAAITTQTFVLANPQGRDTVIPSGTTVSTVDGSIVFGTTADVTVPAYTTPAGTVSITSGSATVTGAGTTFVTGSTWVGWQIQIPSVTGAWYSIASVATTTSLTLTASANTTSAGAAWNVGPITGAAPAQATTTGAGTNVGAGKLTTLVSAASGVSTVTNAAAATGGTDDEATAAAVTRAPTAFATREVACHVDDFAAFAASTLGSGGRARARGNFNVSTIAPGYVTIAMLSPNWTTATTATTVERSTVMRDLAGRTGATATLIDLPVAIQSFTTTPTLFAVAVYRNKDYDEATVRVNVAAAINTYLSPATYPWDPARYITGYRPIYVPDLVTVVEAAVGVDRVESINGQPAIGMNYRTSAAAMTFTNGSTAVSSVGATDYGNATASQTFLMDATNKQAYLVTVKSGGNAFTLDRAWGGATGAINNVPFWTSQTTNLTDWYYLPYSSLSVTAATPAASIVVVGAV